MFLHKYLSVTLTSTAEQKIYISVKFIT